MVLDLAPLRRHGHLRGKEEAGSPPPPLPAAPPPTPAIPGPPGQGSPAGQRQETALPTFPPSFHCPSQFSRFRRCQSASEESDHCKVYCRLRFGFQAHNVFPRSPDASVCTTLLRRRQSASGATRRFDLVCNTKPFGDVKALQRRQALEGLHMAAGPAALGRARRPEAQNADGGPQGRAGPARSPPCSRGPAAQPGPERGPSRPSGAGGSRVRRLGTTPDSTGRPFRPCAARPRRRPAAARSPPAPILRPPPEIRLQGPPLSPPPGTSPAARSPACGEAGPAPD